MKVEPYDFRRPARLAGPLQQRLGDWMRNFCTLALARWRQEIPIDLAVNLAEIVTARTITTLGGLNENHTGYALSLADGVPTLLVFPRPLLLSLALGMLGDACAETPSDRDLTAVEESLTEYLLQQTIPVFAETWPGAEPLAVRLGSKELRPRYTRMFGAETDLITCSFVVRGPFGEQTWQWLVPQSLIHKQFGQGMTADPGRKVVSAAAQGESLVRQLPVELAVVLGQAELSVHSLAQLRVGDLLVLDRRISECLVASVSGRSVFRVWPGRRGPRQAVRIENATEG
jgi:flagellar motor switch protein FliM